uniref:Nucleotide-binding protein ENR59_05615 n=1 Tax=Fundidesulfovibrio putealis TaxID=270496 RepID=A0A7C4EJK3_9BACT
MPSFDAVSKVDLQEVDNAVNNTVKEIATRFDFRGSKTEVSLDKKNKVVAVTTENEMRAKAVRDMLIGHFVKRKVDTRSVEFGDPKPAGGSTVRLEAKIAEGVDKDTAKKIVAMIKDSKIKVQAQIMDDMVRVTGKKIDDLQAVISLLGKADLPTPLQYVNMKS